MPKVSEQKTESLALRLPAPLYQWLESEASREEMNVSEFVRYLLLQSKRREP